RGGEVGALAGRGARVRLAVSLVGGVAGLMLLVLAVHDAELLWGEAVGAAGLLASAATPYRALLRARLRMGGYVGLLAAQAALAVGLLAAVVVAGGGLVAVFVAVGAAAVAGLGLGRLLVGPGARLAPDPAMRRALIAEAWPLAASTLAVVGAQQVLQLLLLRLHGAPEVGLLGGARKLTEAIGLLPQALMLSVLPALSLAAATPAGAAGAAREAARGLVIALLPPAAALALWAEPVLTGFFGPSFAAAAPVLRVLAPATLLGATGAVLTNLLVAVCRQRTLLRVTAGAAVGMIALGAALVPTYGAVGAAAAFVAVSLAGQVALFALPATRAEVAPVLAATVPPLALGAGAVAAAADPRGHLVNHGPKAGIGPAYKEGFRAALALEPEFVVQMDADLSHPPGMLPEFVRLAADHDLVLGSRYLHGITVVNWPMDRLLLSYFGNTYVRIVTGMPIRDATSGFKCWRRAALLAVEPERVR